MTAHSVVDCPSALDTHQFTGGGQPHCDASPFVRRRAGAVVLVDLDEARSRAVVRTAATAPFPALAAVSHIREHRQFGFGLSDGTTAS